MLTSGTQLPRMLVTPPGPRSRALAQELVRHESRGVSSVGAGQIPIFWEAALGSNVLDADGNLYVDASAGFTAAIAGHSNPRIVRAIAEQAQKLLHGQGAVHPPAIRVELARVLRALAPGDLGKCILPNTGAEAVEVALKTAKLFTGRQQVVAFHGGFHGKTVGALAVTSRSSYKQRFGPAIAAGVTHVPYPYCYRCAFKAEYPQCNLLCMDYLEYVLDGPATGVGEVAAIIVEPVQGHEGTVFPPPEFLPRLRAICSARGILLVVDEIITGFGRTGAWFAVNHAGVVPDLLVLAKGIASGFPISAVVGRDEVMDAWESRPGESTHSSTFMGHPVGCAAALACIAEIREADLVGRSARLGEVALQRMRALAEEFDFLADVRGRGLYASAEVVADRPTRRPATALARFLGSRMLERGVILPVSGWFGQRLKFSPPLVITEEQMDCVFTTLAEVMREAVRSGVPRE